MSHAATGGRAWTRPLVTILAAAAVLSGCSCSPRAEPHLWKAVEIPTDADFVGAWFSDSLNGWITGGGWDIEGGIIGRTRDGGRSWSFASGVASDRRGSGLGGVQFRDSLNGWTVGAGDVLLTDDGGQLWRPARLSQGSRLSDIQFIDARNGWALGAGTIVASQDGGEVWRTLVRSE